MTKSTNHHHVAASAAHIRSTIKRALTNDPNVKQHQPYLTYARRAAMALDQLHSLAVKNAAMEDYAAKQRASE